VNRQTAEQRQAEGIATILRERNAYRDALKRLVDGAYDGKEVAGVRQSDLMAARALLEATD
jgi:hypothetical protein